MDIFSLPNSLGGESRVCFLPETPVVRAIGVSVGVREIGHVVALTHGSWRRGRVEYVTVGDGAIDDDVQMLEALRHCRIIHIGMIYAMIKGRSQDNLTRYLRVDLDLVMMGDIPDVVVAQFV